MTNRRIATEPSGDTSRQIVRIVEVAALGFVLTALGCGGSQKRPPNTATNQPSATTKVPASPPTKAIGEQEERSVSRDAHQSFEDAIAAYKKTTATGLNESNCMSVADQFAEVFKDHPKVVEAKYNQAVVLDECGKTSDAERIYKEIIADHPKHGPSLNNLGELMLRQKNEAMAHSYFKRAAAAQDSDAYANLAIRERFRALKPGGTAALRGAINNVRRALAVYSYNIEAYGTLATLIYDHARTRAQLDLARLICLQATKQDPNYAPIYNVMGLVLLRQNEVTRALKQFRKAVSLDDNFVEAHMNIGAITLSFRDYQSAERSFRKVLGLTMDKKTQTQATVGLGVALRGQRQFDEALKMYDEAQKLDPENVGIAYNKAILIQDYTFDANNPEQAISTLEKAKVLLERYRRSGRKARLKDTVRRLKNISEMIPLLREQQKMMNSSTDSGGADSGAAGAQSG